MKDKNYVKEALDLVGHPGLEPQIELEHLISDMRPSELRHFLSVMEDREWELSESVKDCIRRRD